MSRREDYQLAVVSCAMAAKLISSHDIPGLIEDIERADAAGPLLDPTLWSKRREAMGQDKAFLQAALPLFKLAKELAERAKASRPMHHPRPMYTCEFCGCSTNAAVRSCCEPGRAADTMNGPSPHYRSEPRRSALQALCTCAEEAKKNLETGAPARPCPVHR